MTEEGSIREARLLEWKIDEPKWRKRNRFSVYSSLLYRAGVNKSPRDGCHLSDKLRPLPNSAATVVGCRWAGSQFRFWAGFRKTVELDVEWVHVVDPVFGPSGWGFTIESKFLFLTLIL
jgi:hypothetical protein